MHNKGNPSKQNTYFSNAPQTMQPAFYNMQQPIAVRPLQWAQPPFLSIPPTGGTALISPPNLSFQGAVHVNHMPPLYNQPTFNNFASPQLIAYTSQRISALPPAYIYSPNIRPSMTLKTIQPLSEEAIRRQPEINTFIDVLENNKYLPKEYLKNIFLKCTEPNNDPKTIRSYILQIQACIVKNKEEFLGHFGRVLDAVSNMENVYLLYSVLVTHPDLIADIVTREIDDTPKEPYPKLAMHPSYAELLRVGPNLNAILRRDSSEKRFYKKHVNCIISRLGKTAQLSEILKSTAQLPGIVESTVNVTSPADQKLSDFILHLRAQPDGTKMLKAVFKNLPGCNGESESMVNYMLSINAHIAGNFSAYSTILETVKGNKRNYFKMLMLLGADEDSIPIIISNWLGQSHRHYASLSYTTSFKQMMKPLIKRLTHKLSPTDKQTLADIVYEISATHKNPTKPVKVRNKPKLQAETTEDSNTMIEENLSNSSLEIVKKMPEKRSHEDAFLDSSDYENSRVTSAKRYRIEEPSTKNPTAVDIVEPTVSQEQNAVNIHPCNDDIEKFFIDMLYPVESVDNIPVNPKVSSPIESINRTSRYRLFGNDTAFTLEDEEDIHTPFGQNPNL